VVGRCNPHWVSGIQTLLWEQLNLDMRGCIIYLFSYWKLFVLTSMKYTSRRSSGNVDITRSKGTTIETLFKIGDICSSNPTRMTWLVTFSFNPTLLPYDLIGYVLFYNQIIMTWTWIEWGWYHSLLWREVGVIQRFTRYKKVRSW